MNMKSFNVPPNLYRYTLLQKMFLANQRPVFWKNVCKTKTFTDLETQLQERLAECTSHKSKREKHILKFLLLRCQRMKCSEEESHK